MTPLLSDSFVNWNILGKKSHNAKQLASIMMQQASKPTKWTVHSQGAIIFHAALIQYKKLGGSGFIQHQLAIHGSGTNTNKLSQLAQSLGLEIKAVRNNPFDAVPNIAGRNDLSLGSLSRSWKFKKFVTGNDMGASPHTLPYLGIETYQGQLQELGHHKEASLVKKYIVKHCL